MSDIYDALQRNSDGFRAAAAATADLEKKSAGDIKDYSQVSPEELLDMLTPGVSNPMRDDTDIRQALSMSSDPQEALDEWNAAKAWAKIYGMDPTVVFGHSDAFANEYFGSGVPAKTVPRALADVAKSSWESTQSSKHAFSYAMSKIGFPVKDPEGELKQALELKDDADKTGYDWAPREWYTTGAKWIASSLPYMADMAVTGAISGGIGGIVEGAAKGAGKAAMGALMKSAIVNGINLTEGAFIMGGQDFLTMREHGVDEKRAAWWSLGTGFAASAVEQLIGLEGKYSKLFSSTDVHSVAEDFAKRLFVNGSFDKAATLSFAQKMGVSLFSEPTEEGLQALISDTALMLNQDQRVRDGVDPMTFNDLVRDVGDNMWQALVTAPLLGLLPNVVEAVKDKKALGDIARQAPTMSEGAFVANFKDDPALEGIKEGDRESSLKTIWETTKSAAQEEAAQRAMDAKAQVAKEAAEGTASPVVRNESGELRMDEHVEGAERIFTAGSAADETPYGDIVVRDDGDHYTITGGEMEDGYDSLAREMLPNIAARLGSDKPIMIEDHVAVGIRDAWEWAKSNNPRGDVSNANWHLPSSGTAEDEATRNRIRVESSKAGFVTPAQRELVVDAFQEAANGAGLSMADMGKSFGDNLISMDRSGALSAAGKAGAIEFTDEEGNVVPAAEAITKHAKATIYLAENGNFAALQHEVAHFSAMVWQNTPTMAKVEEVYGKKFSAWGEAENERFANEWMAYERDSTPTDARLIPMFHEMSMYLKRLWNNMKGLVLDSRIKSAFDEWSKYDAVKSQEAPAAVQEDQAVIKYRADNAGASPELLTQKIASYRENLAAAEAAGKAREEADLAARAAVEADKDTLAAAATATTEIRGKLDAYQKAIESKQYTNGHPDLATATVLEAKARALEDGSWKDDPLLRAEVKEKAHLELSEDEAAALATAKQLAGLSAEDDANYTLYMGRNELNIDPANDPYTNEAKNYASVDEWIKAMAPNEKVSAKDREMLTRQWEFAHSGKEKMFAGRGDFVKFLATDENLSDFVQAINEARNPGVGENGAIDASLLQRARRVRDAISNTPTLKDAADAMARGEEVSPTDTAKIMAFIRSNEPEVKFLYAEVAGNTDLADEAISDMKYIPPIKRRQYVSKPGRSLGEMDAIKKGIRNDELKAKIDNKTITTAELKEYYDAQLSQHKELEADMKKEARMNSRTARETLNEKTSELKAWYKEREEIRKMSQYMREIRQYVSRAPSFKTNYLQYRAVCYIQDFLNHGGDERKMSRHNLGSIVFETNPEFMDEIKAKLDSFGDRDMDHLTLDDLEYLSSIIDGLLEKGHLEYKNTKLSKDMRFKRIRGQVNDAIDSSKYEKDATAPSMIASEAEAKKNPLRKALLSFSRIDGLTMKYLDGGKHGINTKLLMDDAINASTDKFANYDRRTAPIMQYMVSHKMHKNMFREIVLPGIGVNNSDFTLTASELMGLRCLLGDKDNFNQKQRDAFIFGNLFSADEKDADGSRREKIPGLLAGDEYMRSLYDKKLNVLLDAIHGTKDKPSLLTNDEIHVSNMMSAAMNDREAWMRYAQACIALTGREPQWESHYFSLQRQGVMASGEDRIVDALAGKAGFKNMYDSGMSIERQDISPRNQKAILYDASKVFFDSVMKQEHLANMGPYLQTLYGVYMSNTFSGSVEERIKRTVGNEGWNVVKNRIEMIQNPSEFAPKEPGNGLLRLVRGGQIIGNLAYRLSSVTMQMLTSPLPFITECPGELMKVAGEAWTSGNLEKWYKGIENESPYLTHRQYDPYWTKLNDMSEKGFKGAVKRFGQVGMAGLTFADRFSVAMGWEAVRRSQLTKMIEESGGAMKITEQQYAALNEKAKRYADNMVARTQPSADDITRSPVYQNMNQFKQVILQFTQPLNVIWNNLTIDMPQALRDREYKKFVGYIVCYTLSGLAVGATRAMRGQQPDDDEDKLKYWMLAAGGQFMQSIPLIGDPLSQLTEGWITGKLPYMNQSNMPVVDNLLKSGFHLAKGDVDKAYIPLLESVGMMAGAPVVGIKELVNVPRVVNKVLGNEE